MSALPHPNPFQFFFFGLFVMLMYTIWKQKATLSQLFDAVNSLGESAWGFLVIIVGCIMYYVGMAIGEKDHGVALLILGWGGKMLTGEVKAAIQSTIETKTVKKTRNHCSPSPCI